MKVVMHLIPSSSRHEPSLQIICSSETEDEYLKLFNILARKNKSKPFIKHIPLIINVDLMMKDVT